jgi:hypothetical protein
MTTYEPHETARWSTDDLSALIGQHVSIRIERGPDHRERSGSWAGVVDDAGILRSGEAYIDLRPAGGPVWDRDRDEMRIEVGA